MFVNIVRGTHAALYECSHVRSNYDPETQTIELCMEGAAQGGSSLIVTVSKDVPEALGIYYMNNNGRTIDTVFSKDEGPL